MTMFPTRPGIRFDLAPDVARTVLAIRREHDHREHLVFWSGFGDADSQRLADAVCRWAHDPVELSKGTDDDRLAAAKIRSYLDRCAVMPTPCRVVDHARINAGHLR